MSKSQSSFLKAITGVVLITKDGEDMLCCLEDLQSSKHFTIGQIFNAVRVLNGKSISDYGSLWPKFKSKIRTTEDQKSNDWDTLLQAYDDCDSDYDFLVEVCNQLQEEVPEVIERAKVEKQLNVFKDAISSIAQ